MRVVFPVKLSHCLFVAFCLFMILRGRDLCVKRGKELLKKHSDHIVVANHSDISSHEKKEEEREKRDIAKELPTDEGDKVVYDTPKKQIVKEGKEGASSTSTTTAEAHKTQSTHQETTGHTPVTEIPPVEEFTKDFTTKTSAETTEVSTKKVNSTTEADWAEVYAQRGFEQFKTCLRMTTSDVMGVSDSPLIQKNLSGSRMAAFFLMFELVLLCAEVAYFAGSGEIPRKAGDLIMAGVHTILVTASAALLMRQRFSWTEEGTWGPGGVPSYSMQLFFTECIAWLFVGAYVVEALFRRYMHAEVIVTRNAFGSYGLAEQENRDTFIAAYHMPIDGSFDM